MHYKKAVYYFIIISATLILALPILNISMSNKPLKSYFKHLSQKRLFSTDHLESIVNYLLYNTVHSSLNARQVVIGKEGFFFLGNGFANIINQTEGTFPYKEEDISAWANKLKALQSWYETQGIAFILVVAPNKHTVYKENLPDNIQYNEGNTFTDILIRAAYRKGIHILDLKKALWQEKRRQKRLYFLTDTHWNGFGARLGYLETISFLNATYNKHYAIPSFASKELNVTGAGDLVRLLKLDSFFESHQDSDCTFSFPQQPTCYGNITDTLQLQTCTPGLKNRFNQYSINRQAPNKAKLLYMSDSFGIANTPLYQATFQTVWRLHLSFFYGKSLARFITKHRPDIVIYQVVERDLGENSLVTSLSSP